MDTLTQWSEAVKVMGVKTCIKCQSVLPIDCFHIHTGTLRPESICKKCRNALDRERYYANHEQRKALNRAKWKKRKAFRRPQAMTEAQKIKNAERNRKYKAQYPERARARVLVAYYIRVGKIKKQPCQVCHKQTEKVYAHHRDYSKPLDIVWLCPECHTTLHHGVERRQALIAAVLAVGKEQI